MKRDTVISVDVRIGDLIDSIDKDSDMTEWFFKLLKDDDSLGTDFVILKQLWNWIMEEQGTPVINYLRHRKNRSDMAVLSYEERLLTKIRDDINYILEEVNGK